MSGRAHYSLGFFSTVGVALLATHASARAQTGAPDIEWQSALGSGNLLGQSVRETQRGDFIVAGWSTSAGQAYLAKADSDGNLRWENRFHHGVAKSVAENRDEGYIVVGSTVSELDSDVLLVRTTINGSLLWRKQFGGSGHDIGEGALESQDGGFVVVGSSPSDVYLFKTDSLGNLMWERTIGGLTRDAATSLSRTQSGDFLIGGYTQSADGDRDAYVVRTDLDGNILWETVFGGPYDETGTAIREQADGSLVLAGWRGVPGNYGYASMHAFLASISDTGEVTWERMYESDDAAVIANSLHALPDGRLFVVGAVSPEDSRGWNPYLFETNIVGRLEWEKLIDSGARSGVGSSYRGQRTRDGGYIVTGHDPANIGNVFLLKLGAPEPAPSFPFRRGDANNDVRVDVSDGIFILLHLFADIDDIDDTLACIDAADVTDDGELNISDGIAVFNFLFRGGTRPAAPGPANCGKDPTVDSLGCAAAAGCL